MQEKSAQHRSSQAHGLHGVKMRSRPSCQVSDASPRSVSGSAHVSSGVRTLEGKEKPGKSTNSILSAYKFLAYHVAYPLWHIIIGNKLLSIFSPFPETKIESYFRFVLRKFIFDAIWQHLSDIKK